MTTRPDWNGYFMGIAEMVSLRSTCLRLSVGCVLTLDNRILTTGYNGSPSGLPHCTDIGCLMEEGHCIRTSHAEQNAIVQGARYGIPLRGCTVYITHFPCLTCAKLLISVGIKKLYYHTVYDSLLSAVFLEQADIQTEEI